MIGSLSEKKMNSEDEIKQQALTDNTAQAIFKHLKEIENKREIYEKRWIWELMQNALDAPPETGKIEVEIIKNDNQIIFRHNGRPFKPKEVTHLIYHGTTKGEQGIGKFGTGFLTTHLLSRKVKVKGVREDNKYFEFVLDRDGVSVDDIKEHLEQTWKEYQESLHETTVHPQYKCEYQYPLNTISADTVEAGINDLTKIAPYVLAFNDELGVIKITEPVRKLKFELVGENNETGYIHKIVKEEEEGRSAIEHEFWIVKSEEVEIAVRGKKQNNGICQIASLQDIPKIFLAFPLWGTQDLPFPVVVNSRKFEPTEKRDGIFLGREGTDDINRNKGLLEKACELFIKLISNSESNRWENIHILMHLHYQSDKDWLDWNWYSDLLKKTIGEVLKLKVLKTENGNFIAPDSCFVPIVDGLDEEKIKRLWDLCYCFLNYKDKIPAKKLAIEWARVIEGWKFLGIDLTKIEIKIEKLAKEIENCVKLQEFKLKLDNNKDEFETLNDFYELLFDTKKQWLFDNNILPDQNGILRKKQELFKDEGIDETLKDISNKLGEDVRNKLLHSRISEKVQDMLPIKKQKEILNEVREIIKQPRSEDDNYLQANMELFKWLLEHDKFEYLEGYPILSSKEKTFTQLSRQSNEKLLAPKDIWNETARIYSDIFPQDLIISSFYHGKISQKDNWDKLKDYGLILIEPLYNEVEKLSREDLESLLFEGKLDDDEHEIKDDVEVSKIAFLDTKDKGIIDTVRKSKDKSKKFLDFLFRYVIENDGKWNSTVEVSCGCGTNHKISPAFWMAQLKNRSWVPVRKGTSEKPNAQLIASLIETDKELIENCKQDKPSTLLNRLNISISELMMYVLAKDEKVKLELDKAMGSLFSTFMTDPSQLSKIAELAKEEPRLFIKEMEDRLQNARALRTNQEVGTIVEKIVKSVLDKEGFEVEKTGVGSDFVIRIRKNEKECFLEVKSTSQDCVRMTLTQAKEAKDKSDRYVLCVIELNGLEINEENIKSGARFVVDIGQKIQDKVEAAEDFKFKHEEIVGGGDIEIEISEVPIRLKINKRVWEDGKTCDQFFSFLREL